MKALVTGGAGFIGSNLALELEKQGWEVSVLDNFLKGNRQNLSGFEGQVIEADLRKAASFKKLQAYDAIFHQAAITDTTIQSRAAMNAVNVSGFRNVLGFAARTNADLVFASSASVYGNGKAPMKESQKLVPLNAYAKSKLGMEKAAEAFLESSMKCVGLRYFNVFGPREQFKGAMASMVFKLAVQMLNGEGPRVFKWGQQCRDQVFVKDVVQANLLALKAKQNCIVNIGSGKATSFNRIIEVLNKELGTALEPDYFDCPYGFCQELTQADLTKAEELLNYSPRYSFEQAVEEYAPFIKEVFEKKKP